ncbi:hypothetical protein [uncultured Sphingomonas sp.]|uniref:hypothetical protein n=1 Tax=uncultured Sphingomonas sp. TaxID=158754 RepID=UPI0035CA148F
MNYKMRWRCSRAERVGSADALNLPPYRRRCRRPPARTVIDDHAGSGTRIDDPTPGEAGRVGEQIHAQSPGHWHTILGLGFVAAFVALGHSLGTSVDSAPVGYIGACIVVLALVSLYSSVIRKR